MALLASRHMSALATASAARVPAGGSRGPEARSPTFEVHLDVFAGPFDLLLGLIGKHQLDVTEVSLAQVTDEFVAYVRAAEAFDLDQMTGFLVVAATLLDLKAARLLPGINQGAEDAEDLALLEARDLLFARLLQYRAYQTLSDWIAARMTDESRWVRRTAALPPEWAAQLPPLDVSLTPRELSAIAVRALTPRSAPIVAVDHVHLVRVSVPEHMEAVTAFLATRSVATFGELCAGCTEVLEVVARFLAVLELYRAGSLVFEQQHALGVLRCRRAGSGAALGPDGSGGRDVGDG